MPAISRAGLIKTRRFSISLNQHVIEAVQGEVMMKPAVYVGIGINLVIMIGAESLILRGLAGFCLVALVVLEIISYSGG